MVLAALSTAARLPWKGCADFFFAVESFLTGAACFAAAGLLVVCARSCTGMPAIAAASTPTAPTLNIDLSITFVGSSRQIRQPIATRLPQAGNPNFCTLADLPSPLRQQSRYILGQVGREQRQGLALGARYIGRDADEGVACDRLVQNQLAGAPIGGSYLRPQLQPVVAHRQGVAG